MTGWQTSRSTDQKHEHTTIRDSKGQDVCSSCNQIIIKPVQSSDDPRLTEAGFMRSPHHEVHSPYLGYIPLGEMLVWMYNESQGEFPVAPYLLIIQGEHMRRGDFTGDTWDIICERTKS